MKSTRPARSTPPPKCDPLHYPTPPCACPSSPPSARAFPSHRRPAVCVPRRSIPPPVRPLPLHPSAVCVNPAHCPTAASSFPRRSVLPCPVAIIRRDRPLCLSAPPNRPSVRGETGDVRSETGDGRRPPNPLHLSSAFIRVAFRFSPLPSCLLPLAFYLSPLCITSAISFAKRHWLSSSGA